MTKKDKKIKKLVETLRTLIDWSECVAMRLEHRQRRELNWRALERARKVYSKYKDGGTPDNVWLKDELW